MSKIGEKIIWYEHAGFAVSMGNSPKFIDLLFKRVDPKWFKDRNQLFVQRIDSAGEISEFIEIDFDIRTFKMFPPSDSAKKKSRRIGDPALFAIQFENFFVVDQIPIFESLSEACSSAISNEKMKFTSKNPLFALAISQIAEVVDLEIKSALDAYRILGANRSNLAVNWFNQRNFSKEAKSELDDIIRHLSETNEFGSEQPIESHIRVAVLERDQQLSFSNSFHVQGGILVSFHIKSVDVVFKERASSFDAIVAPYANFFNGEDLDSLCKIALVPHQPSVYSLSKLDQTEFSAILHDGASNVVEDVIDVVIRYWDDKVSKVATD